MNHLFQFVTDLCCLVPLYLVSQCNVSFPLSVADSSSVIFGETLVGVFKSSLQPAALTGCTNVRICADFKQHG